MKVLQINTVFPNGSTGKICKNISEACERHGIKSYVAFAHGRNRGNERELSVSSWLDHHIHNRLARMTMSEGSFSRFTTKQFLRKVSAINPDIIHLHNIHANYIHLETLFSFLKKTNKPVVWTLHDCWAYTGFCKYYDATGCDQWKKHCAKCPKQALDPVTVLDRSYAMYEKKRTMFTGVKNMTLVVPSDWLKKEVMQSFLKECSIRVIHNGIDLSVFSPRESSFREEHGLLGKNIILGVAFDWGKRKGLDVFSELALRLPENYQIVLVGTNDAIDMELPPNIISIHRTNNQTELAEIYAAADVFVNPTREDNYPTVNMESLACGTPVITFRTGGSPEIIDDTCGCIVEREDIEGMVQAVKKACENSLYPKVSCLERAKQFDMKDRFDEYLRLYEEIL